MRDWGWGRILILALDPHPLTPHLLLPLKPPLLPLSSAAEAVLEAMLRHPYLPHLAPLLLLSTAVAHRPRPPSARSSRTCRTILPVRRHRLDIGRRRMLCLRAGVAGWLVLLLLVKGVGRVVAKVVAKVVVKVVVKVEDREADREVDREAAKVAVKAETKAIVKAVAKVAAKTPTKPTNKAAPSPPTPLKTPPTPSPNPAPATPPQAQAI